MDIEDILVVLIIFFCVGSCTLIVKESNEQSYNIKKLRIEKGIEFKKLKATGN